MSWIRDCSGHRSFAVKVSISKSGTLCFNEGACERYAIKDYAAVVLYYDDELIRVGIECTSDRRAEGARMLRKRSRGSDVAILPFLRRFGIDCSVTRTYTLTEEGGKLIIALGSGSERKSRLPTKETLKR